ncbi:serum response factor homolog A-like, partial [Ochlerotatus camptorhynchus]|uniref:serum response factor homolog A-like n=1 Tax=Ochlerotatus camptorhynchus TaxID=644619 RepID=UPI0031D9E0B3
TQPKPPLRNKTACKNNNSRNIGVKSLSSNNSRNGCDQLRKQQQKQLEREQQFRPYQQQQRQEQIRQESLLRQQQEDLRKEADAINRMWEQQLEQERILRDQQQQLADGQGVMRRPSHAESRYVSNLDNSFQTLYRSRRNFIRENRIIRIDLL